MIETGTESATAIQSPHWWKRQWLAWSVAGFLLVAFAGALAVMWGLRQMQPMLRRKVVETLSARFHSPVELDRLEVSLRKGVIVTGGGLRILYLAGPTKPDARPNAPPMLAVRTSSRPFSEKGFCNSSRTRSARRRRGGTTRRPTLHSPRCTRTPPCPGCRLSDRCCRSR